MDAYAGAVLTEPKLTLLGDGAHTVDLLGYQPYVDAMVEVLAQKSLQTPFTVGVFGRWGTGKSTFMNLLHQQISIAERQAAGATGGFHAVRFQPWQFEDKEEVWKALLLSVIRYLQAVEAQRTTRGEREAERIRATLGELALSVGKLAVDKAVQSLTAGAISLDDVLTAYARTAEDNSRFINTFREQFSKVKQDILGADGDAETARLFIFVDDLDRCTPDNCIMVLEAIKLFFDLPECVFVLGIDREVVQRGIEVKYRNSLRIQGQDYIDKIVQLPFSLPPIHDDTFTAFVNAVTADFDFDDVIRKLIATAADSNPRSAKRLSNCLQLTKTVAERLMEQGAVVPQSRSFQPAKLALLLTLQVRYPVIYRWLTRNAMPLSELESNWQPKDPDNPESGVAHILVEMLRDAYDARTAAANTAGFKALWQHAEQLGVEAFADAEELQFYMRLTGIVDEERAREDARDKPALGVDSDADFVIEDEENEGEQTDKGDPEPTPPNHEPADADGTAKVLSVLKEEALVEARELKGRWTWFERVGVVQAVWRLPGLLRIGAAIVDDANDLRERVYNQKFSSQAYSLEVRNAVRKLDGATRERMLRHAGSIAGLFAMMWPVALGVLGGGLELLFEAVWAGTDPPETVNRILKYQISDVFGGIPLTEWPYAFPGGLVFFWMATLYTLLAGSMWLRTVLGRLSLAQPVQQA